MNYKKRFFISFLSTIIFLAVPTVVLVSFILSYDPLQICPKGYYIEEKFIPSGNMREQAKGIIDNVQFDSIILGDSMLENSSATELAKLLGGNYSFVNISLAGSNYYERSLILDYILKRKNIKNIVYSFKAPSLGSKKENLVYKSSWPTLYDENISNDFNVYYDLRPIIKSITLALHFPKSTHAALIFFDRPKAWFQNSFLASRFGGLKNWISANTSILTTMPNVIKKLHLPLPNGVCSQDDLKEVTNYTDLYLLSFVKDNPHVNFYILIPPNFRYIFAYWRQTRADFFALYQESVRDIVKDTQKYPNLKIYGFEDMEFLDDIENYIDTSHYHQTINSMMNYAIANGEHLLTLDNIDAYLEKCDQLAQNFDIKKFYDDACTIMRKQGIDPKTGDKF